MGALALLQPAETSAFPDFLGGGLSFYPVIGDNMTPTLKMGEHLVVGRGVTGYEGEGLYIFEGGVIRHAERRCGSPDTVYMWSHNRLYSEFTATLMQFGSDVIAKVVADVKIHDHQARQAG